jgi:hypothetical protein
MDLIPTATFLYNNYVQALTLLREIPMAIASLTRDRPVTETIYHQWLDKERQYLESKQQEPESDIIEGEYVALLMKLKLAKSVNNPTLNLLPLTCSAGRLLMQLAS